MIIRKEDNVIQIEFGEHCCLESPSLFQWDTGQIIQFLDVADETEVQFVGDVGVKYIKNGQVEIPDILLQKNGEIIAYVRVINEKSETTKKTIKIPIKDKPKTPDYVEPEQEQTFRQHMESIMTTTKAIAEGVQKDAEEGKFNGQDYVLTEEDKQEIADITLQDIKRIVIIPKERNYQNPFNVITELELGNIYIPENSGVTIQAIYGNDTKYITCGTILPTSKTDYGISFWMIPLYGSSPQYYSYSKSGSTLYENVTRMPTENDVLTKYNATSFSPYNDYGPATKKYVDDKDVYEYKQYNLYYDVDDAFWKKSSPMYIFKKGFSVRKGRSDYTLSFDTDNECILIATYRANGGLNALLIIPSMLIDNVSHITYSAGIYDLLIDHSYQSVTIRNKYFGENEMLTKVRNGIRTFASKLDGSLIDHAFYLGMQDGTVTVFEKGLKLKNSRIDDTVAIDTDDPLFIVLNESYKNGINTSTECSGYVIGNWTNNATGEAYTGINFINFSDRDNEGNSKISITKLTNEKSVEPAVDDIPKIFINGTLPTSKGEGDMPVTVHYSSKTKSFDCHGTLKVQGNSSTAYPKKNFTLKMYEDEAHESKLKVDMKGWGKQSKFVLKANWIDLSHARNIVSARLWANMVRSRANYESLPELYRNSPNLNVIDGFPVKVYNNGVYQGRYSWNIPKDKWAFNMDDSLEEHCVLCGEDYSSACFRASAAINGSDWTDEIHDEAPYSIKNRWNTIINFLRNATDDTFKSELGNYFDVASLIDYWIFAYVSCGLDCLGKNQIYLTYDGNLWYASMYDMDSTWGLYWNGNSFVSATYRMPEDYEPTRAHNTSNLLYDLLANNFVDEIKERYAELRRGALSVQNIINRFERFTDICPTELMKEDFATTTANGAFTAIPSQNTNNIQQIRKFVVERLEYVDSKIEALARVVPCTGITLDTKEIIFGAYHPHELVATLSPINTTDTVMWTSSNPDVATVSDRGVVTPVTKGTTVITATCGDVSVQCSVEVTIDVLVYSLPSEKTFVSANSDYVDTGIQLLNEDKNFSLYLDYQGSANNTGNANAHMVLHCMNESNPWPGLALQLYPDYYVINYYSATQSLIQATHKEEVRRKLIITKEQGASYITVILDGQKYTMNAQFSAVNQTLLLGCYQTTAGTKGRFWNGTIYECKVWNKPLSEDEINELLSSN